MGDSKQQTLVNSISDGVHAKIAPDLAKVVEQLAKLQVSQNACLARLELLESSMTGGGTAAKRSVRTGGAAKGVAAKKSGAKKGAAGDDKSKVTNALLYFRYAMANNLNDAQDTYGTAENIAAAETDSTVAKRDKEKDPVAYWSAVGAALWKTQLSDDQKEAIRNDFGTWKEQSLRDASDAPLEEDPAEP